MAGVAKALCVGCGKTAYPMEQIVADGSVFHKGCFRCSHCKGTLKLSNFTSLDGVFYCKPHFDQKFQTTGSFTKSFEEPAKVEQKEVGKLEKEEVLDHQGGPTVIARKALAPPQRKKQHPLAARFGGVQDTCLACSELVYPLEKVRVDSGIYHKSCFRCSYGGCVLSTATFKSHQGKLYCRHHLSQLFLNKGNFSALQSEGGEDAGSGGASARSSGSSSGSGSRLIHTASQRSSEEAKNASRRKKDGARADDVGDDDDTSSSEDDDGSGCGWRARVSQTQKSAPASEVAGPTFPSPSAAAKIAGGPVKDESTSDSSSDEVAATRGKLGEARIGAFGRGNWQARGNRLSAGQVKLKGAAGRGRGSSCAQRGRGTSSSDSSSDDDNPSGGVSRKVGEQHPMEKKESGELSPHLSPSQAAKSGDTWPRLLKVSASSTRASTPNHTPGTPSSRSAGKSPKNADAGNGSGEKGIGSVAGGASKVTELEFESEDRMEGRKGKDITADCSNQDGTARSKASVDVEKSEGIGQREGIGQGNSSAGHGCATPGATKTARKPASTASPSSTGHKESPSARSSDASTRSSSSGD